MIPISNQLTNEQNGILETVNYSVKAANVGTLFSILRSQLYSDPILAVIREYSTNAVDANVVAGKPKESIIVSLPTLLDPFFKVRDFGPGITDEDVVEIFSSYGESTKRRSNKFVGQLGIGNKSGFAYNDSFIVNSYRNGVLTSWNSYIDPSNIGSMAKMATCETTEQNGLEIVIPVKNNDIEKFRAKAFDFFRFFTVKPEFKNITPDQYKNIIDSWNKEPILKGENWQVTGDKVRSYAVMGNIGYPIDTSVFISGELSNEVLTIISWGILLNFKIGEIEFSASRESIQYSPHTKKIIIAALEKATKEILVEASKMLDGCKTLWDAKITFMEVIDSYGKFYYISKLLQTKLIFNGKPVKNNSFDFPTVWGKKTYRDKITCSIYGKGLYTSRNGRVGREQSDDIRAHKRNLVVVNDKNVVNGILNRIVGPIERKEYDLIYLIKFTDDNARAEWIQDTGFDGPMVNLSSLPKEPLDKYYPDLKSEKIGGVLASKSRESIFIYNPKPKQNYNIKNSDYWEVVDIDITKESGIYVYLDRFEYFGKVMTYEHPVYLINYINNLKNLGVQVPKIYGIRTTSSAKHEVLKNNQMLLFEDFIINTLNNLAKIDPKLEQSYVDFYSDKIHNLHSHWNELISTSACWTFNNLSPLNQFTAKARAIFPTPASTQFELVNMLGSRVGWKSKLPPSIDLRADFDIITKRYPLFFHLLNVDIYSCRDIKFRKNIQEYIDMVDKLNP